MKIKTVFMGIAFVLFGVIILLGSIVDFPSFAITGFWPLFLLSLGLISEVWYLRFLRFSGFLVGGGVLFGIGAILLFDVLTGGRYSWYVLTLYPLAAAFGLLQLYLFHFKFWQILIPIYVLSGVSLLSITSVYIIKHLAIIPPWLNWGTIAGITVVALGAIVMTKKPTEKISEPRSRSGQKNRRENRHKHEHKNSSPYNL